MPPGLRVAGAGGGGMLSSRTSRAPRKGRWMLQIAGFHGSCCQANCGLVPPCQVPCGSRSDALFLFLPEEDPAPSTQTFSSVYSSHLSRGLGGPCPRRAPCRLGAPWFSAHAELQGPYSGCVEPAPPHLPLAKARLQFGSVPQPRD